ncbi:MAG TPA: GNAT family N-acetyltransferase [Terriglobales bacterium]
MLTIRTATRNDAPLLTRLIQELAEFERLGHETAVTEEDVARDGFGERPRFRALIAEWDKQIAGYALFFEFYSSFQGRPGLFLEDIFVRADFRQHGIGTQLLAAVAKIAWDEDYFCLRWEVLDWNKPAIDFYEKMGAEFLDEWRAVMLIGDPLQAAAKKLKT